MVHRGGIWIGTDLQVAIQCIVDQALANLRGIFSPNGIRSHLYNPDGVLNAALLLARFVISTFHKKLAIFSEQYHIALSMY